MILLPHKTLLNKAFALIHQSFIWNGLAWQTEALQVRLWLLAGDLTAATTWASGLPSIPTGPLAFSIESREICRARVLLAGWRFSRRAWPARPAGIRRKGG